MSDKNDEAQGPEMLLPWAELITKDLDPIQRKEAIQVLFEQRQKAMSLSEEVIFNSCAQLAMMRLLSDLLEQDGLHDRARDSELATLGREGPGSESLPAH